MRRRRRDSFLSVCGWEGTGQQRQKRPADGPSGARWSPETVIVSRLSGQPDARYPPAFVRGSAGFATIAVFRRAAGQHERPLGSSERQQDARPPASSPATPATL
ncbi:hypothetical protein PCAR4_120027 [Paraburkholderia caribensis]|nr:hypothetical protein PCAR4_120027 [Paraburkholderia caribensis]